MVAKLNTCSDVRYGVHLGERLAMKKLKDKSITELRSTLFETFDEVVSGNTQYITHKNGTKVAMVPTSEIEELKAKAELHKSLAIGYAQALRGEGVSSNTLKERFKKKEKDLKKLHG